MEEVLLVSVTVDRECARMFEFVRPQMKLGALINNSAANLLSAFEYYIQE
jgi:hypothetical protein